LIALAAILIGVLGILAPLRLSDLGWGGAGLGAVFLVAAGASTLLNPLLGRWADRRGRIPPILFGLIVSGLVSIVMAWGTQKWVYAAFVLAAGVCYGLLWTPAIALLSDASEARGLGYASGFALMNLAWAPGHVFGSAFGGALAQVTVDAVPYLLAAALCFATLISFTYSRGAAAELVGTAED
jgi:DHA1 family tetracycline resistance protein-like MFS transporter